ncbi:MAG TPA: hypothetical protein DCW90_19875 [Lachnospiraceae bacterium]|nr:cyclic lactone autoinducer peptide [uncultured Lachnoclostridium sp.]HAU87658.1 hypothetical protein [Lachnospiraceae bacterium]
MIKMEKAIAKVARHCADMSMNKITCTFWWYQPKVTDQLKSRVKEMRKQK